MSTPVSQLMSTIQRLDNSKPKEPIPPSLEIPSIEAPRPVPVDKNALGLKLALSQLDIQSDERHFTLRELICLRIKLIYPWYHNAQSDKGSVSILHDNLYFLFVNLNINFQQTLESLKKIVEIDFFSLKESIVKDINDHLSTNFNVQKIPYWKQGFKLLLSLPNLEDLLDVPLCELMSFEEDKVNPDTLVSVEFSRHLECYLEIGQQEKMANIKSLQTLLNVILDKEFSKPFYNTFSSFDSSFGKEIKGEFGAEKLKFYRKIIALMPSKCLDSEQLINDLRQVYTHKVLKEQPEQFQQRYAELKKLLQSKDKKDVGRAVHLIKDENDDSKRLCKKLEGKILFCYKYFELMRLIYKLVIHSSRESYQIIINQLSVLSDEDKIDWMYQKSSSYIRDNKKVVALNKVTDFSCEHSIEESYNVLMTCYSRILFAVFPNYNNHWRACEPFLDRFPKCEEEKTVETLPDLPDWLIKDVETKSPKGQRKHQIVAPSQTDADEEVNPPEAEETPLVTDLTVFDKTKQRFRTSFHSFHSVKTGLLVSPDLTRSDKVSICNHLANSEFHHTLLQAYPDFVQSPAVGPFCFEVLGYALLHLCVEQTLRGVELFQNFDNSLWLNGFKGSRHHLFTLLENSGITLNRRASHYTFIKKVNMGSVWTRYPYTTPFAEHYPAIQRLRAMHQNYLQEVLKTNQPSFQRVREKHAPMYQIFVEQVLAMAFSISSQLLKVTSGEIHEQQVALETKLKDGALSKDKRDILCNASFHLCLLQQLEGLLHVQDKKIKALAAYGILFHAHPFLEQLMLASVNHVPVNDEHDLKALFHAVNGVVLTKVDQDIFQHYAHGISQVRYPFYQDSIYSKELHNALLQISQSIYTSLGGSGHNSPTQEHCSQEFQKQMEAQFEMCKLAMGASYFLQFLAKQTF